MRNATASRDVFNIGDYVIMKNNKFNYLDWYHTEPMLILGIKENKGAPYPITYTTNYSFKNRISMYKDYEINHVYVELDVAYIRNDKLERLLYDEDRSSI